MGAIVKPEFSTLLELLQYRASDASGTASKTAFTYLENGEQVSGSMTFGELDHRARSIAAHLQRLTQPGDRVLLVHRPGLEYIVAFFACVYARVIAVPALPPANRRTLPRLQVIGVDAVPRLVLTSASIAARMGEINTDSEDTLSKLTWLASDGLSDDSARWVRPDAQPEDIVFLQYTSGSTGSPKGVCVNNGNILANTQYIASTFVSAHDAVLASWLPPHHDMGLIGKILFPIYGGHHCVQFPPAAFMMKPYRWLKILSDYRVQLTAAPNFAFELCVDKVTEEQKKTLDLSGLKFALNGAEPIRPGTLRRFAQAFAACGLRPEVLTPVYGMAEATLLISGNVGRAPGRLPRTMVVDRTMLASNVVQATDDVVDQIEFVSVGSAQSCGHHVLIVDPLSNLQCENDRVGEIWVQGPSVAGPYWNRQEASREIFSAATVRRDGAYLRTGDLGFIHGNELYIAGRIKEMMIFNGRNIYPQDIERTVEQIDPAFRANGCAAFSLEEGKISQLVIVQEIEARKDALVGELLGRLRTELAEQHEVFNVAAIVLVKAGHIPRTSSGKIQRLRCKALFLLNELSPIWEWRDDVGTKVTAKGEKPKTALQKYREKIKKTYPSYRPAVVEYVQPKTGTEQRLAIIWSEYLGIERISSTDNFFTLLGGHSLSATQVISKLREEFNVEIPLRTIYDASTLAAFAHEIDLAQRQQVESCVVAIAPVDRSAALGLSFAQQRLWFLDQLEPGSAFYNIPAAVRLVGSLDVTAITSAINEIVRRHESLRTLFSVDDGVPVQVIIPMLELDLAIKDLTNLPHGERTAQVRWFVNDEARTPFDLSSGPLVRVHLLRLDANEHVLLLTLHHIVSDGWSMGVLLREMGVLYAAYAGNQPSPLPELAIQYADFAHWQRQWLSEGMLQRQIGYWAEKLKDAPALLDLPTNRLRPAKQSYRGATLHFAVSAENTAALNALGKDTETTLFMVLAATFNVLLSRYTGQTDICIGTAVANRNRTEIEALIGFFVNTLVLRTEVDGNRSFIELLQQVRNVALEAYANQDVPFEKLVEVLMPERHANHSPLFQVLFVLQNAPMNKQALPGLTLNLLVAETATAKFDLTLIVTEESGQLSASFEYNTDLFDSATIERMADHFTRLLDAAVLGPDMPVGALEMLGEAEREYLLHTLNATQAAYPQDKCIHELFEEQAGKTPEAIAVVFEEDRLTYGELNEKANRLAHYLREKGVKADSLVGLCVERSLEMMIGMLGILKAGGAYVPLDPAYPRERLAYMVGDANPVLLLTQEALAGKVRQLGAGAAGEERAEDGAGLPALQIVTLDGEACGKAIACYPASNPQREEGQTSRNLAYVIYTSGSTGHPKGVMVEHKNLVSSTQARIATYSSIKRFLLLSSVAFDSSIAGIFGTLSTGGSLIVLRRDAAQDPQLVSHAILKWNITHLLCVPSLAQMILEHLPSEHHGELQEVTVAGEVCPPMLSAKLAMFSPTIVLYNEYGPTETTVWATVHRCSVKNIGVVPIGRPIANTQIFILDTHQHPAPVGVTGEIYIGGASVARGYLNRPELTAERFVRDPFSANPAARMYKSGDLGRYLPDGNIEYLGRNDDQVKIRGFRIELGEIESRLVQHEEVGSAVVLAREEVAGEKRLVAYVTAKGEGKGEGSGDSQAEHALVVRLKQHLQAVLPEYMVPSLYVLLEALPLTPNGKIDKKALPAPDVRALQAEYVAPRTQTERTLAGIWSALLHVKEEELSITANFFALGGHSLLAIRVVAEVRKQLDTELSIKDLFNSGTLLALAATIDDSAEKARRPQVSALERKTNRLPLSFAQQRLWFLEQMDGGSAHYNMPTALRVHGRFDETVAEQAFARIIERHEPLRTVFVSEREGAWQVIRDTVDFKLQRLDLRDVDAEQQEQTVREAAREDAVSGFDLSTDLMLRAWFIRLGEEEGVLLFNMHHIASDGWSMGVLTKEFILQYEAVRKHQANRLAPLAIQYADYAQWQRNWLAGEVLEQQLSYWDVQLSDLPPVHGLRLDRPRPARQSFKGARHGFSLGKATQRGLKQLAQAQQATLFMVLHGALSILMARHGNSTDVVIGTPVANRLQKELEDIIGFFVNTLVLRSDCSGNPSFIEYLQQIKATNLDAQANQDIPFEYLVERLKPRRSIQYSPLFQIMFSMDTNEGGSAVSMVLQDVRFSHLPSEEVPAKFELTFNASETEDGLALGIDYNSDLFDAVSIERLAAHFNILLEGIAANPDTPIHALPLLGEAEREYLLYTLNATQAAYPQDKCIHELFEEQAGKTPEAIAVVFEEDSLTYGELNEKANRLAHYLREKGVKADSLVGLCVERSLEMMIGMLGILKAGGAYVPLDPAYPRERLAYMVGDANPVLLLTQEHLLGNLPIAGMEIFCLDAQWEILDCYANSDLEGNTESDNLAYVIYTSGSTGTPKGVAIEHRSAINLVESLVSSVYKEVEDFSGFRVGLNASFAFDASVQQLLLLIYGASLHVISDRVRLDAELLISAINDKYLDALDITPSHLMQLLSASTSIRLPEYLLVGGEAISLQLWNALQQYTDSTIYSVYGPTEATVDTVIGNIHASGARPIIGRPIANTQVYILDSLLQPVPLGVAGELYIGGAGVARGYLNRPELTAERFVQDPFSANPAARMYKSGDLGRYLPDGNIEYLGRNDDQVKIRGFRIELGEIESRLVQHEEVGSAVVLAREEVAGEKRLVAYVTAKGEGKGEGSGDSQAEHALVVRLKQHLQAVLPEYMVPSLYVLLEALPLTPNGKIDKKALPAPDVRALQAEYVAPRTRTERTLAGIWSALLHVREEELSITANFFALGGHSLLVIQLLARLQQAGLHTDVRTVFGAATLGELAATLDNGAARSGMPFTAPANRIPAECAQITPEMLPLVDLSQEEIDRIVASVPGGARNVQDIYPLAPLQEGILFHHLMHEENDPYILPGLLSMKSRVQLDAFLDALQKVADRHDVLRTAILSQNISTAVQVVYRQAGLQIARLELDASLDVEGQLMARLTGAQRMNIEQAPLLRVSVAQDPHAERCFVLLQLHHIISDHIGLEIIQAEVTAYLSGQPEQLTQTVPYREFVAHALHQAQQHDAQAFFKKTLGDVTEPTAPFNLLDVHGDGSAIEEARKELAPALASRIRQAARQQQVSPATLFHTAWAMVVGGCSGRDDVVFGTVLSGRLQGTTGAAHMLGMFINTLPVRLKLQGQSVKELVAQTEAALRDLLSHEQASLALAQRCSGLPGGTPLFSAMLNYRHTAVPVELKASDETSYDSGMEVIGVRERTNYPFNVSIDDLGEGFSIDAQIDRKVDAKRVIAYIEEAIEGIVDALESDAEKPVRAISILPEAEREYLLYTLNATQAAYPQDKCIHELFEEQAGKTPEAIAVVFEEDRLTYGELNEKANRLAHYLREKGVKADSLVGLCVERSLEMMIGMLGILKAGGAYVPLDPAYPRERLAYMVGDANPVLLLTQEALAGKVRQLGAGAAGEEGAEDGAGLPALQIVTLDGETCGKAIACYPASNPQREEGQTSRNLAYVIYTSGSTGQPKGVMVEHANLANLVTWHCRVFELTVDMRSSSSAGIAFDATVWEVWSPLCVGASLVLPPTASADDPEQLIAWWKQETLDVSFLVTPMAELALSHDVGSIQLQHMLIGGERLRRLPTIWPSFSLINNFGPTETTVVATSGRLAITDKVVHIGRPIANTQIYILDSLLQPVPLGVAGELYIGGAGVARGYLNRPELTAERFVQDPFSANPAARMYKSGDLGRYLPDGNIEYLGRNDDQVKIRGFRIELGEIESRLVQHEEVGSAVVLAREEVAGEKRLVAYVTAKGEGKGEGSGDSQAEHALVVRLKQHLQAVLPEYMVPSLYVLLEALPLTPNGKIDKKALPAPDVRALQAEYVAPRTRTERTLAGIWSALLHVKEEELSITANFFALGGHSLLVIQLLARLQQAGLHTDVRTVFGAATLGELAATLDNGAARSGMPFTAPANRIPAECAQITPEMLPLVDLSQEEIDRIVASVPGGARNVQDIYPLAPLQEGILFHHLMHEENDPYILPGLLSMKSRVQLDAFLDALQKVADRHDVLRTAILSQNISTAVQVVYRQAGLQIARLELDASLDVEGQLMARLTGAQRMNIEQAPLLRVSVAQDPHAERCFVLLQLHHIISDHIGLEIIQAEVTAYLSGQPEQLTQTVPYREFVAHALHQAQQHDAQAFFKKTLGDVTEPTAPFNLLDVHGDGSAIEEARKELAPALASRIRQAARQQQVSPATLFHTAWAMVVGGCSGRDDVVFGTVLSGRLQGTTGAAHMLGMFINTLPVRLKLQGQSVKELVAQTEAALRDLLSHEQASLALAQRCSGLPGGTPLFSAMLNYRHTAVPVELKASDETSYDSGMEVIGVRERTNYPFNVSIDDLGEGFSIDAQIDRKVDAKRVIAYIEEAIEGIVDALESDAEKPVRAISILPEAEREYLLYTLNATQAAYPQDKCIHELFEEQAGKTPEAIAVVFEEDRLTYGELNEKANRLAHYLREKGVKADSLVGLCVERSLEMMIGMLGILKAGGAYVPLDPAYPRERLAHMLMDARPSVLLTQECLRKFLPQSDISVFCLDASNEFLADYSVKNPVTWTLPDNLVYVIYTSGSTGRPKGVAVRHGGFSNLLAWYIAKFDIDSSDRGLLMSSISFDLTQKNVFSVLAVGGQLHLPSETYSPMLLNSLIEKHYITFLNCAPSAFYPLLSNRADNQPSSLRQVFLGGEPIQLQLLRDGHMDGEIVPVFHNTYGPTEASDVVASFTWQMTDGTDNIPIGTPISNTQIYLLDENGNLVPTGVAGELYIAGAGLAHGYLNRPELTAEKFIPNPFSTIPSARMYKSGDLARYLPDGNIEYLGRNDDQVKIRGFRIELGEIESRLVQHEEVGSAVVLAREEVAGEKRLVAYVTAKGEGKGEGSGDSQAEHALMVRLKQHLQAVLPEYMVPSLYVLLEALPLTPNGKIDKKALPAPDVRALQAEYVAPRTRTERTLAGIWSALLHVREEELSITANFFALGGHSLLVIQLLARLQQAGLHTDVRTVFGAATLGELAATLDNGAARSGMPFTAPANRIPAECAQITPEMLPLVDLSQEEIDRIVASVPGGARNVQDIYPLAPLQEGILFHHLMHEENDPYILPGLLSMKSRVQLDAFLDALQKVADRHDVLRTAILSQNISTAVQVVYRQAGLQIARLELDASLDVEGQLMARLTGAQRMNIEQAPLLRVSVAQDPHAERCFVLLQLHHIISDHIGLEIIQAEVTAYLSGQPEQLTQTVPYREFVAHALHQAQQHDAQAFFKKTLGDVTEPTAPFNLLDVHGDGSAIEEARKELAPALASRIRQAARQQQVSPATLFHTAWAMVVGGCSGRDDVVFGTVLSGRLQGTTGAAHMLGMFINTLPVRLKLQGQSVKELVAQTEAALRDLLSHEQASLALAQRCSGLPGGTPLFSAMLNYRHTAVPVELKASDETSYDSGMEVIGVRERTNYPFNVSIDDLGEGFSIDAQIDRKVDAKRVIAYIEEAIEGIVDALESDAEKPVRAISILPEAEREYLLYTLNATQAAYPQDKCIHELFEEQAGKTPEAIAVVFEEDRLTYGELNEKANRLAHYLREKGVKADSLVGLCVERSLEMMIGMLGILKAGGAYVPLDPAYPRERLAHMLMDARPSVLLTQECLRKFLPQSDISVFCLDASNEFLADYSVKNPVTWTLPDNLVYVIYTSGSTGRPKGVAVRHGGFSNLLAWYIAKFDIDSSDRGLLMSSISFDLTQKNVFSVLAVGGQLHLPSETYSPMLLNSLIEKHYITFLNCAPSAFYPLLSNRADNQPSSLRQVFLGGEPIQLQLLRDGHMDGEIVPVFHNTYGPTEASDVVASFTWQMTDGTDNIPIGTPISNTQIYLLDENGNLVPTGVAGELYIAGAGLAHGYLNRPELTAEKFIPNPFSTIPSARMYKSGDLARYLPDGNIEYLGRNDDQVKIRGFRIELGEIESRLVQHEEVGSAVVLAREEVAGEKRLVAYVTAKGEGKGEGSGDSQAEHALVVRLKQHLQAVLPEYMVPSLYVLLEALPLTPNGKIDKKALPAPDVRALQAEYVAPRTRTERTLAGIWSALLHVKEEELSITANFFALGGHSLLAIRVVAEVRKQLDTELSIKDLFNSATLSALAATIDDSAEKAKRPQVSAALLRLLERYGATDLQTEILDALGRGVPLPNAVHSALERRREELHRPPPVAMLLPEHVIARDATVQKHQLDSYDQLTAKDSDDEQGE